MRSFILISIFIYSFSLYGMEENSSKEAQEEALFFAAQEGDCNKVKELLDAGVPVDPRDGHSFTPFLLAADKGHLEVMELLQSRGAQIDAHGWFETTALHQAAFGGHLNIVTYLIEQGFDKDVRSRQGETPFLLASGNSLCATMKYLVETVHVNINAQDCSGNTALHKAAQRGDVQLITYLLSKGVKKVKNHKKQYPKDVALTDEAKKALKKTRFW